MEEKSVGVPVKVPEHIKDMIKLGAASLKCTMGEIIDDAVSDYLGQGEDMLNANQSAIHAGEPIPFTRELFSEEIIRRRSGN